MKILLAAAVMSLAASAHALPRTFSVDRTSPGFGVAKPAFIQVQAAPQEEDDDEETWAQQKTKEILLGGKDAVRKMSTEDRARLSKELRSDIEDAKSGKMEKEMSETFATSINMIAAMAVRQGMPLEEGKKMRDAMMAEMKAQLPKQIAEIRAKMEEMDGWLNDATLK